MAYEHPSKIEAKRSHQWFTDGVEPELLRNKKQAVEVPDQNSFSGLLSSNISWGNFSSFNSIAGQFTDRLFDPETGRTINFDGRNVLPVGISSINMGKKLDEDPFGGDLFGLSISPLLDDPRSSLNFGGIRKVKVCQVKDSENLMPVQVDHSYNRVVNSPMSQAHTFSKAVGNCMSMGLSFNNGDDSVISVGETFNKEHSNLISISQPLNMVANGEMTMCHPYKENNKDEGNIAPTDHAYSEEDGNTIAGHHPSKENDTVFALGHSFSKDDNDLASIAQTVKGTDINVPTGNCCDKIHDTTAAAHNYKKIVDSSLSIGHSFSKGGSDIISFGGFNDDEEINPSSRLLCTYDLLMNQTSVERSEPLNDKGLLESNSDGLANSTKITSPGRTVSKKEDLKSCKKPPPDSFPSNVRSLLSTGMLDGVPVKYIAWSREIKKELRGIIKGSGYLCGCQSCNFSKAINAYEFERHAGCKTKHPNNHIYFDSGKTIYGIVQELRNTPKDLLFEVLQTITGSPINQKSFRLWKESFLAATRELQRIYGKDEGKRMS